MNRLALKLAAGSGTVDEQASACDDLFAGLHLLGPATTLTVKPGARLVIRSDCPMDFDFLQTKGPRLQLGNARTYAGSTRLITFRTVGTYRLTATNVQTPEERGLVTLGKANTLTLMVIVRR